ncbi:MAG: translocation/assembly module TamB domain-containing protein [Terracidiphilus sp.]|jgi:translocation and assembly module TamB
MSDPESTPPVPETPEPDACGPASLVEALRPSRWRRFFLRHLPLSVAGLAILLAVLATGLYFLASTAAFENFVRERVVHRLELATGGRVEIRAFHWNLLRREAEADGLVIHGLEGPNEAPYAQVERLRVRLSVLGFLSPRILLRDLEIYQPKLHLIIYPDGSTNQPHPRTPEKPNSHVLDKFFDFETSHISVEQGLLEYENRAAAFDFQDRFIPLDFGADDLSLRMTYMPAKGGNPEFYHIEAGIQNLNLSREVLTKPGKAQPPPVEGLVQATLDVSRTSAILRSLRVTAQSRGVQDRTLEISGFINNFSHPSWQGRAAGELDMRLLDPVTGYPFAPEGIAHLNVNGSGQGGSFRIDGSVHVENGAYIGTGVVARGVGLDARVHADPQQLLISSIVARLREGGQIEGDLSLARWLPPPPTPKQKARSAAHKLPPADEIEIPVDGKVTAQFKDVPLDTILEMVCDPPFQHLGLDARVSGPANAVWINGDNRTVSVVALLNLTPPAHAAQGKAPTSGLVDATYTQRDGAVDLRKLRLNLPSSQLEANGHLGAYPLASPSALKVDFHTGNLGEFDTVLRDLGMARNGKTGVAALPVAFYGQTDFHGTWTGSLLDPHLAGNLKATQLNVEVPDSLSANYAPKQPAAPQFFRLDAIEASGSYSAARIDITSGVLRRGNAEISLTGSIAAGLPTVAPGAKRSRAASIPSFATNSLVHLRLRANQLNMEDLRPFTGPNLRVAGSLEAQVQVDGPLHALVGSGWLELDKGNVYGEPVNRIRAQGTIANQTIKLTSVTVNEDAGKLAATGSYDLQSHRFQLDAKGAGIDVSRIQWLRNHDLAVSGKLGLSVQGSCTFDNPCLEAHATLAGLTLNGVSLGSLELTAHGSNHAVTYDIKTRLEAAELAAHGQTALGGDFATHAKLDFSQLNIGALFKMAHINGLTGESSLAGTVTIDGPLGRPDELRGEAKLDQMEVTLSGVHLKSDGGVHATLANAVIHLDPLHVVGEETNLHAQGSLSIKGNHELDFAANGAINLKVAETLDPDLTANGDTTFQVEAHGPLMNPRLNGRIDIQNASLSLEDLPNGLSQLHGTLEFNQNRLEIKSLTAMTGGGQLSVAGYLAYQHGIYADLTVTGSGIRIRYPQGVSSLADASLRLQGPQTNLLLSGDVLITRFTISPDLDIAALTSQANTIETVASPDAPSNHVRLDVHITSSPQLNFQNAYAKLAGNVDLHLRGTIASPSLLGRISITEGSSIIAGTRYELQRGDIYFTNPVRIQPLIDLTATARVEDYDITLSLHGTPDKLSVSYRSDPPLPEADVVALLALGRTGNQQRLYTQQQEAAGTSPATDALLGGALNATVSSRVQRLFGAGSVKVDPNYLGALGNSTSRIIVEEQLGTNVTLTYATNVNTTAQQLIQAEVAVNRHITLQLARDESGVFSVVIKATRRFK